MFELIITKKGKYKNDCLVYQYKNFNNLVNEVKKWLENGTIKESDIFNIRHIEVI